jgi:hypothetical protein
MMKSFEGELSFEENIPCKPFFAKGLSLGQARLTHTLPLDRSSGYCCPGNLTPRVFFLLLSVLIQSDRCSLSFS